MTETVTRTYELEDISIRAGGDGRTVVAYAAVFGVPAEIHDREGHYLEVLAQESFNRTIQQQAGKVQVFYNHGKTLFGTPSERFSMPLGVPEEITADHRGVLTVTRYDRTPLADEVLEGVRNGSIRAQSFSGRFIKSQRSRARDGGLDTIVRNEVALREYGPTPIPAYAEAAVLGVRMEELIDTLRGLDQDERAELFRLLSTSETMPLPASDAALQGTHEAPDTPADLSHLSPTPAVRRNRLWHVNLTLKLTKELAQ